MTYIYIQYTCYYIHDYIGSRVYGSWMNSEKKIRTFVLRSRSLVACPNDRFCFRSRDLGRPTIACQFTDTEPVRCAALTALMTI